MNKKSIAIVFVIFALALSGCIPGVFRLGGNVFGSGNTVTETREVSGFSRLMLDGEGTVNVVLGDAESLVIEAEDNLMQYIETEVRGSELVIGTKIGVNIQPTRPITYTVTVKSLDTLSIDGSGNINANDLTPSKLTLRISGSGTIRTGNVQSNTVDAKISGSGSMFIDGQATSQAVTISGSGNYVASDLESDSANVTISGSGSAEVWAAGILKAQIPGSGVISYYGSPQMTQSITGSGRVIGLGGRS